MYFKEFPTITATINDTDAQAVDLFIRFKIKDLAGDSSIFYPYRWKDTDRPDTVADKYYGDSKYYWVVFYSNNAFDLYYDFPLNPANFETYIINKYGSTLAAQQKIHHYEQVSTGYVIDVMTYTETDPNDRRAVTCMDYEISANEDKRNIQLISRKALASLLSEYQDKMKALRNA